MEYFVSLEGIDCHELEGGTGARLHRSLSLPPTPNAFGSHGHHTSKLAKFLSKYHVSNRTMNIPSSPSTEEQPDFSNLTCSFSARRSRKFMRREPSPPQPGEAECEIIEIEVTDEDERCGGFELGMPSRLNLQSPIDEEKANAVLSDDSYDSECDDNFEPSIEEYYDEDDAYTIDTFERLDLANTTIDTEAISITRDSGCSEIVEEESDVIAFSPRSFVDEDVKIVEAEDYTLSPRSDLCGVNVPSDLLVPFHLSLDCSDGTVEEERLSDGGSLGSLEPVWDLEQLTLMSPVDEDEKALCLVSPATTATSGSLAPLLPDFPMDKYILLSKKDIIFDRGSSGQIRLALHEPTCEVVALKFIGASKSSYVQAVNEIEMLERDFMRVTPQFVELSDYGMHDGQYVIALKYVNAGNLEKLIENHGPLAENAVRFIARQLLLALKVLHENRIIHNDFKPSNVLLSSEGHVKLCDFGLSCSCSQLDLEECEGRELETDPDDLDVCDEEEVTTPSIARILSSRSFSSSMQGSPGSTDVTQKACAGTVKYIAPEKFGENNSVAVDIWAFGVTMFECCSGMINVRYGDELTATLSLKVGETLRGRYSYECQDFISRCIETDVDARFNVDQLLSHPFLCQIYGDVEEECCGQIDSGVKNELFGSLPCDSNLLIKIIEALVSHHKKKSFLDGKDGSESESTTTSQQEQPKLSSDEKIANISSITRFSCRQVRKCIKYYTRIQRRKIKNH